MGTASASLIIAVDCYADESELPTVKMPAAAPYVESSVTVTANVAPSSVSGIRIAPSAANDVASFIQFRSIARVGG